jgi:predicted hotdog family 3-hydroxylacyl-ACP dehydratase
MKTFDIEELVPHSGKMRLLERVIDYDQQVLTAEVIVRQDGLFDQGQTVPAWLGIEYMAQTIAAFTGMADRLAGRPVRSGFLLGTRRYDVDRAVFEVGQRLKVTVKELMRDQALAVFECQLSGHKINASAKLNVYQPPEKSDNE